MYEISRHYVASFIVLESTKMDTNITVSERKCIVIEIGWSLGILYSGNRTPAIKDLD